MAKTKKLNEPLITAHTGELHYDFRTSQGSPLTLAPACSRQSGVKPKAQALYRMTHNETGTTIGPPKYDP